MHATKHPAARYVAEPCCLYYILHITYRTKADGGSKAGFSTSSGEVVSQLPLRMESFGRGIKNESHRGAGTVASLFDCPDVM